MLLGFTFLSVKVMPILMPILRSPLGVTRAVSWCFCRLSESVTRGVLG